MAWQYDDEDCLVRDISHADPLENRVVCWINGAFNRGPEIAMAPLLESLLRECRKDGSLDGSLEDAIDAAFRDLDEARAKVAS